MSDNKLKLLVPVHLDAMVINKNRSVWKDLSLTIDNLSTENYSTTKGLGHYLEKNVQQKGSNNNNNDFYEDGIHLHWVLPAALRHGIHNEQTNSLEFPLVPNRWLVVRMDEKLLQIKSWIVESDFIEAGALENCNWIKQNTNPHGGLVGIEPVRTGRTVPLTKWSEKNTNKLFLTAVAPGNPDFGASYMHCKNVFGFYDDLSKVAAGSKFSYRVYGWFSDTNANPFAGLNTKESFLKKMDELSWTLKGSDQFTDDNFPRDMICHASVSSVLWSDKIVPGIPAVSDLSLGIGNSSSEALAALLRDRIHADQLAVPRKLLAAFQYKLLSEHGLQDNSFNLLKKQMHSKSFNSVNGGTYWVVEPQEKNAVQDGGNQSVNETSVHFNSVVSGLLKELNDKQRQYDMFINELKSSQSQLYALKYKELYAGTWDAPLDIFKDKDQIIFDKIEEDIKTVKQNITDKKNQVNHLKQKKPLNKLFPDEWPNGWAGDIAEKYTGLKDSLLQNKMSGYIIKEVPMPVFYKPSDPAVVIDGLKPSPKYLNKNSITCRTPDQITMTVKINYNSGEYTYKLSDIINVNDITNVNFIDNLFSNSDLAQEIKSLVKESILLDPLYTVFVANFIISKGNPLSNVQIGQLVKDIDLFILNISDPAKAAYFFTDDPQLQAVLPENFSVMQWAQPWTPLYLEWEVTWRNTYNTLTDNTVLQNWKFGNGGNNIDYNPEIKNLLSQTTHYYGRTILSDSLSDKITDMNKKLKDHSGKDLFQSMQPMSQTLDGFNNQLLMRYHGIQLPVLNSGLSPDHDLMDLVEDQYYWCPMANLLAFQPLRAGFFELSMLRVIDSFGQVLEIMPVKDKVGNNISPSAENKKFNSSAGLSIHRIDNRDYFAMGPRIVQPSRIRFDWMSANDSHRITDADPGTSPVCGWLLHNKMDQSISVFDDKGVEIGELEMLNNSVAFNSPPGSALPSVTNTYLDKVVNFARTDEQVFNELMKQIDEVNQKVQSKVSRQELTMLLPVGFPVAVVLAQCTLELKDQPAQNQYWDPAGENTDFSKMDYTVCVGNANSKMDGLVGYFIPDNNYVSINLPFGAKSTNSNFKQDINVSLQIGNGFTLTLLMDPRLAINISSGILPAAAYELPGHLIAQPLKDINLRFLAAPVLTPATSVKIPLMQSNDITWNWISQEKIEGKNTISVINPDSSTREGLKFEPLHVIEGWLKINSKPT